ncbi:hypothetical protein ABI_04490 [Asticcacaulis biprosthecium C19]|uniref:Ribosomal protein S1 n=1 Tax=Asticcacaulis biprosthecium C19 TaxID=715226 RepID=F4QJZ0_9CAUL|nr:DUF6489 family protein [Asticcacaulis biprosthecium]EGF92017.1 hypothetical protein ABI_04490 [Asticcacaulis biprosthecium C19]
MKVTVNVECSPQEARAFLGLPDVEPLNDYMISAMKQRMEQNIHSMKPEEMMKNWSSLGVTAQDQFFKLMQSAAQASMGSFGGKDAK